jgi:hypothetical protein
MNMKYFKEGVEAYRKGIMDCPYPEDSEAYKSWQSGHADAWYREHFSKELT